MWNSGGAMTMVSGALNRIRDRIDAAGPRPFGAPRLAPFGAPVVPDVSTIRRPLRCGTGRSGSVLSARSSSVGSPGADAVLRRADDDRRAVRDVDDVRPQLGVHDEDRRALPVRAPR